MTAGLVPAPQAGQQEHFLCADGTWKEANETDRFLCADGTWRKLTEGLRFLRGDAKWEAPIFVDIDELDEELMLLQEEANEYKQSKYNDKIPGNLRTQLTEALDELMQAKYSDSVSQKIKARDRMEAVLEQIRALVS